MSLTGKKIIVVGDSHSEGVFGSTLKSSLEKAGAQVTLLAVGGSAAASWLKGQVCRKAWKGEKRKGPKCESLDSVRGQKFDLALVALGTNDAANAYRASREGYSSLQRQTLSKKLDTALSAIEQVASRIDARNWFWIGPPVASGKNRWYTMPGVDAIYARAEERPSFKSRTIDSRQDTVTLTSPDGVHFYGKEASKWAAGTLRQLQDLLGSAPLPVYQVERPFEETPELDAGLDEPSGPPLGLLLLAGLAALWLWRRKNVSALAGLGGNRITYRQAKTARHKLPRSLMDCDYTTDLLAEGMEVELEHRSLTHGDHRKTAMIAAAHLCERKDYYKRLKKYVE